MLRRTALFHIFRQPKAAWIGKSGRMPPCFVKPDFVKSKHARQIRMKKRMKQKHASQRHTKKRMKQKHASQIRMDLKHTDPKYMDQNCVNSTCAKSEHTSPHRL